MHATPRLLPHNRAAFTSKAFHTLGLVSTACIRSRSSISFCNAQYQYSTAFQKPANNHRRRSCHILSKTRWPRKMKTPYCPSRNFTSSANASTDIETHNAFIALGSNMGDRFDMIERACRLMDEHDGIRVKRTSGLWQTKAMYVTEQADFLNGVCEIETNLKPLALLDALQEIELALHRKKIIDKGPRTIDLDILLYDDITVSHDRLIIPHKLMLERAFVLQPLCQLIPSAQPPTKNVTKTYIDYLQRIPISERPDSPLTPLSPIHPPLASLVRTRRTQVMSILNLTPDSFSDGGKHSATDVAATSQTLLEQIHVGATIIDVGGQSTRPGAHIVEDEEEAARVVPMIRHLSSLLTSPSAQPTTSSGDFSTHNDPTNGAIPPRNVAISIDTFRASVARAAVQAGAHIVNDVSAGTLDPAMLPTVADLGCTIILMHMRGTPDTMSKPPHTLYPNGLIETIGSELLERVQAAEAAGIRRWRIILDPGIGFAKTAAQNLEVLRSFAELRRHPGLEGLPWVVGASRKGFIGKITGVSVAKERIWGSAVAVTAAVQGGADVVRVHDVAETVQVVRMADAIWRV